MRKTEAEITDRTEIEEILGLAKLMHLGMNGPDGPYVIPLIFGYQQNRIYFHTGPKGKKRDLLAGDKRVCFEIDIEVNMAPNQDPCSWNCDYRTVVGYGQATVLEDHDERTAGLNVIMRKYDGKDHQFPEKHLRRTTVLCIEIDSMTGRKSVY